jgi:hypothetical protein
LCTRDLSKKGRGRIQQARFFHKFERKGERSVEKEKRTNNETKKKKQNEQTLANNIENELSSEDHRTRRETNPRRIVAFSPRNCLVLILHEAEVAGVDSETE